eukprot:2284977-Lingulodinium_polyedra.AAC.1
MRLRNTNSRLHRVMIQSICELPSVNQRQPRPRPLRPCGTRNRARTFTSSIVLADEDGKREPE